MRARRYLCGQEPCKGAGACGGGLGEAGADAGRDSWRGCKGHPVQAAAAAAGGGELTPSLGSRWSSSAHAAATSASRAAFCRTGMVSARGRLHGCLHVQPVGWGPFAELVAACKCSAARITPDEAPRGLWYTQAGSIGHQKVQLLIRLMRAPGHRPSGRCSKLEALTSSKRPSAFLRRRRPPPSPPAAAAGRPLHDRASTLPPPPLFCLGEDLMREQRHPVKLHLLTGKVRLAHLQQGSDVAG